MNLKYFLIIPTISFVALSCMNKSTSNNSNSSIPEILSDTSPVETKKPNTDILPAFKGQTRVRQIHTTTPYQINELATNIGKPWNILELPDGRYLVNDKTGFMQIFSANGKLQKKITGIPAVDANGQGGLLGAVLDPDFVNNRMIYFSFSEKQSSGNLMAVAKGKLSADEQRLENTKVIFRAIPALNSRLHFGSRLVFDRAGNLFVSTGERSIIEGRKQAQLLTSSLGKIFRMDKDGNPISDNTFMNVPNAIKQIYSYGHRNPQGLAIHPTTGAIWESEMGPQGGDEINIIEKGKNYGWPTITYGEEYSGETIGDGIGQAPGMEQPIYYWDPVISPSGITFYASDAIPEWKNNLFIGGLSGQHIARLAFDGDKVIGEERLLVGRNERYRDVTATKDGRLLVVTDEGKILELRKKK